ncbi:hypothetical protein D3C79_844620 [compost metagenome]
MDDGRIRPYPRGVPQPGICQDGRRLRDGAAVGELARQREDDGPWLPGHHRRRDPSGGTARGRRGGSHHRRAARRYLRPCPHLHPDERLGHASEGPSTGDARTARRTHHGAVCAQRRHSPRQPPPCPHRRAGSHGTPRQPAGDRCRGRYDAAAAQWRPPQ